MADISVSPGQIGPQIGPKIKVTYAGAVRRKRLYSGIFLLLFVLLMASGFQVAQQRNASDFLPGLTQLGDFPGEVLSEEWTNRANIPGLMAEHFRSLLETINIAAVSSMIGALIAFLIAPMARRGLAFWPRMIPLFRRIMDVMRAFPEIILALVLIYIFGGGPAPAMIAIAIHTAGALGEFFSEVAENADHHIRGTHQHWITDCMGHFGGGQGNRKLAHPRAHHRIGFAGFAVRVIMAAIGDAKASIRPQAMATVRSCKIRSRNTVAPVRRSGGKGPAHVVANLLG